MQVMDDLRSGRVKPDDLNADLFEATKNKLLSGAGKGFGQDMSKVDYATPDYNYIGKMRSNLHAFAGAKTRQHLYELNNLMLDKNGNTVPFHEFRRKVDEYRRQAMKLEDRYNDNWLTAEYDTAIAQAQHAAEWKGFEADRDIFPNLKYRTIPDEHRSIEHGLLEGIIAPVDSPIWDRIAPVKRWRCRCWLEQTEEEANNALPDNYDPEDDFEGNVGKTGNLMPKKHAYYEQNGIDMQKIEFRTDQLLNEERIRMNGSIYESYIGDENYINEYFDEQTGGFIVRHRNAQYEISDMPAAERKVIDMMVRRGNRVILPEYKTNRFDKNFDMTIDFSDWDVKHVTGDVKRRTEQHIKEAMGQADNVIVVYDTLPDIAMVRKALHNVRDNKRLNTVMLVYDEIMAVISQAEIKRGDFTALDVLK